MHNSHARRTSTYIYASIATAITVGIIAFPEDSFRAALDGLAVWWEIVFPALLPFFVASEILMGLGVVHMLGVLLEPLMRPMFNVPGVGSVRTCYGFGIWIPDGSKDHCTTAV